MSFDATAVIVMASFPAAGKVKARLIPPLTPDQAASVYREFLVHLIGRLDRLTPAEIVVCYDPPDSRAVMKELLSDVCSATYLPQEAGDLGGRMSAAAKLVGAHYERMLFVSVDGPDVPEKHLTRAAELTSKYAVSLGPTTDGGWWSLGLWNQIDSSALLDGMNPSSRHMARQILERAEALGYATGSADPWDDVDRPDDLKRLLARLAKSAVPDDRNLLKRLTTLLPDGVAP